jgi:hypothetical protein
MNHKPKPGRVAFVCPHKEHEGRSTAYRMFVGMDDPIPSCPQHGKMVIQPNNPYLGQPIPTS